MAMETGVGWGCEGVYCVGCVGVVWVSKWWLNYQPSVPHLHRQQQGNPGVENPCHCLQLLAMTSGGEKGLRFSLLYLSPSPHFWAPHPGLCTKSVYRPEPIVLQNNWLIILSRIPKQPFPFLKNYPEKWFIRFAVWWSFTY